MLKFYFKFVCFQIINIIVFIIKFLGKFSEECNLKLEKPQDRWIFTFCFVFPIFLCICESESEIAQSCPTLCNPMDCSLPGSSVHGIFQARILEWVAISFSRRSPNPGIKPESPALQGRFFTAWATRQVLILLSWYLFQAFYHTLIDIECAF